MSFYASNGGTRIKSLARLVTAGTYSLGQRESST
jgi:hypothetical protein